jgi:hypothetical protein
VAAFIAQPLDRQQWDAQLWFIRPKELNPLVEVKPSSPPMLEGKAPDSQMCQKKLNGGANPVRRRPAMAPIQPKSLDQLQSNLARTGPRNVDQSKGWVKEQWNQIPAPDEPFVGIRKLFPSSSSYDRYWFCA